MEIELSFSHEECVYTLRVCSTRDFDGDSGVSLSSDLRLCDTEPVDSVVQNLDSTVNSALLIICSRGSAQLLSQAVHICLKQYCHTAGKVKTKLENALALLLEPHDIVAIISLDGVEELLLVLEAA